MPQDVLYLQGNCEKWGEKDGHQYTIIDEPEIKVFKRPDENVIITNSAVELFGDIVEIE